jgi:hypothetical protein
MALTRACVRALDQGANESLVQERLSAGLRRRADAARTNSEIFLPAHTVGPNVRDVEQLRGVAQNGDVRAVREM